MCANFSYDSRMRYSSRRKPAVGEIERRYDALPPETLGHYWQADPSTQRRVQLTRMMALARRQAHLSSQRARRARTAGDAWGEAFAILDLLYHRDRHRLARRQAGTGGLGTKAGRLGQSCRGLSERAPTEAVQS